MVHKNILLASVLKPCDDTRMYEKMAMSVAQLPTVCIHVIGHKVNRKNITPNIKFHPIFSFQRLTLSRLWAPWKYAIQLLKVKPDIIIVNTHELLIVTVLYRIIFGAEIYYDIQENYFQNIAFTRTFPRGIRYVLAGYVRIKETILSPFFHHFILAEACYAEQLPFIKSRPYTVVANKFMGAPNLPTIHNSIQSIAEKIGNNQPIRFVYSGTIAEEYGIFEAIGFIKKWIKLYPNSQLEIIGFCPKESTRVRVKKEIFQHPNISLVTGGDHLVPHPDILLALGKADVALLPYRPLAYTKDRIPTKLYECMAFQLPMIIQTNAQWEAICQPWGSAIFIDFSNPDISKILNDLTTSHFYPFGQPIDIFWETEAKKLLQLFIK